MTMMATRELLRKKGKIVALTCYDYSFAAILDAAGVDVLLVGDSLANVVLGMKETRRVSTAEMLNHTRAVALGAKQALVVADMPYAAYQKDPRRSLYYARKFLAVGAHAVKIEWFKACPYVVKTLVRHKIPVMGHIGLTPQTAHLLGGLKVQGQDERSALSLLHQAELLQKLGVFSLILECVPQELARAITRRLRVPTIGIGAGRHCRGQVLVLYDFLGLYPVAKPPRFVKTYLDLSAAIKGAVRCFAGDVQQGRFPAAAQAYHLRDRSLARRLNDK